MARLRDYYVSTVAPALMSKFGYKNVMQIPRLDKVVVNVGAGEAKDNAKAIDAIMGDLSLITGQRSSILLSRVSVTSAVSTPIPSTARATTLPVSRNSSFSLKLSTIRSTRSAVWISTSSQPLPLTKRPKSCSRCSARRSQSDVGGLYGKEIYDSEAAEST